MRPKDTPNDAGRRDRIVAAAMEVLLEEGVSAITARAVAARAQVPVGSVSYYFPSVRSVLLEAVGLVVAQRKRSLEAWSDATSSHTLMRDLAALIHEQVDRGRALTVLSYELHVLGLRDEAFRGPAVELADALVAALTRHMDSAEASRLAQRAEGVQLNALLRGGMTVEELQAALGA